MSAGVLFIGASRSLVSAYCCQRQRLGPTEAGRPERCQRMEIPIRLVLFAVHRLVRARRGRVAAPTVVISRAPLGAPRDMTPRISNLQTATASGRQTWPPRRSAGKTGTCGVGEIPMR